MSAFGPGNAFLGGPGPGAGTPAAAQVQRTRFFSGAGTFVVPAGVTRVHAQLWGGAGSGSSPTSVPGGGGASGGYVQASVPVSPGDVLDFSVGPGGPGVAAGAGAGSAGGDTTLALAEGWQLLAAGGGGALNAAVGGVPGDSAASGLPAGSDVVIAQGIHGAFGSTETSFGGAGASSPMGGPGAGAGVGFPGGFPGGASGGGQLVGPGPATSTSAGAAGLLVLTYLEPAA